MKKKNLFLVFTFVLIAVSSMNAQELAVTYKARLNTSSPDLFKEAGLPEEMRQSLITAYRNIELTYGLAYVNGESEFKILPSDKKQEITFMGQTIDLNQMMSEQLKNGTYRNHNSHTVVNKISFFGKVFLVKDSLSTDTFNVVAGEKKEILGYECIKAVSNDKTQTIWFTENIPIAEGPICANVNGLILEANLKQYVYIASAISDKLDHSIIIPVEGKEMNSNEFKAMVKKRTEMMKMGNSTF